MSTNITAQHRHAFEALTSGRYDNVALFSCFIDRLSGVAIVAVNPCPPAEEGGEPEYTIRPLFVSIVSAMKIADHDGRRGMSGDSPLRRRPDLLVPPECRSLIERGVLVVVNRSGGKDSQCMTILLSWIVPGEQLLVVHALFGEVEWPGTIEHIENTICSGVSLILAGMVSGKSLLERIEERGRFPDSGRCYRTSDAKRTPIERELRRYLKAHSRFGPKPAAAIMLDRAGDRVPYGDNSRKDGPVRPVSVTAIGSPRRPLRGCSTAGRCGAQRHRR